MVAPGKQRAIFGNGVLWGGIKGDQTSEIPSECDRDPLPTAFRLIHSPHAEHQRAVCNHQITDFPSFLLCREQRSLFPIVCGENSATNLTKNQPQSDITSVTL